MLEAGGGRVYEAAGCVTEARRIKATHGRAFQINARAPSQLGRAPSEPMANGRRDLVGL